MLITKKEREAWIRSTYGEENVARIMQYVERAEKRGAEVIAFASFIRGAVEKGYIKLAAEERQAEQEAESLRTSLDGYLAGNKVAYEEHAHGWMADPFEERNGRYDKDRLLYRLLVLPGPEGNLPILLSEDPASIRARIVSWWCLTPKEWLLPKLGDAFDKSESFYQARDLVLGERWTALQYEAFGLEVMERILNRQHAYRQKMIIDGRVSGSKLKELGWEIPKEIGCHDLSCNREIFAAAMQMLREEDRHVERIEKRDVIKEMVEEKSSIERRREAFWAKTGKRS